VDSAAIFGTMAAGGKTGGATDALSPSLVNKFGLSGRHNIFLSKTLSSRERGEETGLVVTSWRGASLAIKNTPWANNTNTGGPKSQERGKTPHHLILSGDGKMAGGFSTKKWRGGTVTGFVVLLT